MLDVLKQLGKSDAKAIDRATATAVATRAGASSMLSLAIVKLGEQVRLTAELVRIDNGSIIATFQQHGQRIDDVFAMVDGLTEDIAARFGLSRQNARAVPQGRRRHDQVAGGLRPLPEGLRSHPADELRGGDQGTGTGGGNESNVRQRVGGPRGKPDGAGQLGFWRPGAVKAGSCAGGPVSRQAE